MNRKRIILLISVLWSLLSLLGGVRFINKYYKLGMENGSYPYSVSKAGQILAAVIAFAIAVMFIFFICSFICKVILDDGEERKICFFSLPFVVVLTSSLMIGLSGTHIGNYYTGDEANIWNGAVMLYPFFFVYTSEIFLICFFILPVIMAPSVMKIIFCSFVMGYTVNRIRNFYKTNLAFALYGLCLLKPVYEMGIRVHRMHWYGVLYLFFAVKAYFDSKENNKKYMTWTIILMSCISAILTVLRREGIYLFVFGAIIMVLAYAKENGTLNKKSVYKILAIFMFAEILFYLPAVKNGFVEKATTYRAYIVHMLGERTFNRELVAEELDIVDQFMNIEIIDRYNADMGIDGFADCMYDWPWWRDGSYLAVRSNPTVTSEEFARSVLRIIMKEPVVFMKSRIRAFCAAARSANSYNLFLPFFILIIIMGYSILKRDKLLGVISCGVFVHTGITTLTMPASYNKYFYEMLLFSYFFIIIMLIELYLNSDKKHKI